MNETVEITNTAQRLLLILTWFPLVFAILATGIRFYSRRLTKLQWLWDDWLCLAALLMLFGVQISIILATYYGGNGLPFKSLTPGQMSSYLKLRGAIYLIYVSAVTTIQASILCLYIRVFGVSRPFRYTCYFMLFLVAGWWAAAFFSTIGMCDPVSKAWTLKQPGTCLNGYAICGSTGILHVVLDFVILALPTPMIWRLETATSKKIIVTLVFSMGILATACAVLRMSCLVSFVKVEMSNLSGTEWMSNLWEIIEVSLGVLCVSVPTMPPVWAKVSDSKLITLTKSLLKSSQRSSTTDPSQKEASSQNSSKPYWNNFERTSDSYSNVTSHTSTSKVAASHTEKLPPV